MLMNMYLALHVAQDEAPPRYERACEVPLAEDTTITGEGRAVFSRKSERRNIGAKCFNCGSYGHALPEVCHLGSIMLDLQKDRIT